MTHVVPRSLTLRTKALGCILLLTACGSGDGKGGADDSERSSGGGSVETGRDSNGGASQAGNGGGTRVVETGGSGGQIDPASGGPNGASGGSGGGQAGSGGSDGVPGGYQPPASVRSDTIIDDGWKFNQADAAGASSASFSDSAWSAATLPHTWNGTDGEDGGNDYYRGIGWYRRHYTLPADATGKNIYLQFDGASTVADVFVNGTNVGQHRGAFARFRFDVTAAMKAGDNVIAVKVNNAIAPDVPPLAGDFTVFGGLYRDVHVLTTDKVHVDVEDYASSGVYLETKNVSAASADLKARVRVRNNGDAPQPVTVSTVLVDAGGVTKATLTATGTVQPAATSELVASSTIVNPHLWNGRRDPYLYSAYSELRVGGAVADVVPTHVGFRSYSVDANKGFFLNGTYLDLHGVNEHQDRMNKGWAVTNEEHDQDFALIQELGATAVRLCHYQHAEHAYDLTDRIGLVTWAEVPLVNTVTNSTAFTTNAKQQLTELIRQNFNHPSIAFWSLANEEGGSPDPNPVVMTLNELAHTEDPSRLTTLATNSGDSSAINYRADLVGFNKYYGWYGGSTSDFAPWLDAIHRAQPTKRVGVSEFGAGASIKTHTLEPRSNDHSEEYQNLFHETYWKALSTRPFIWGKFVWVMFDFASDGRAEGDTNGRNDKGLVTYDRQTKKDAFFWYKANWSDEPVVYITSRRFTTRVAASNPVKVYANASSVELKLNGTSLGSKTSSDHIFSWTVALGSGSNTIEASATIGGKSVTDSVTWTH